MQRLLTGIKRTLITYGVKFLLITTNLYTEHFLGLKKYSLFLVYPSSIKLPHSSYILTL